LADSTSKAIKIKADNSKTLPPCNKFLVVSLALVLSAIGVLPDPARADYREVFDISGNHVFAGEELLRMEGTSTTGPGSGAFDFVNDQRLYRDWGATVNVTEWVNNMQYNLDFGRVGTWFTPLTLHKERFRPGYANKLYDRWWDQRTVRFRLSKADRETTMLFAKTANANDDDEWWGNTAAYDNIDIDRYFFAFRHRFNLAGQTLGFSFANEHFSSFKGGGIDLESPLQGDIPDDTPVVIAVLVRDDSPLDKDGNTDQAGAAVYNIRTFVDGAEDASLAITNGDPAGANTVRYGNFIESADRVEMIGPTSTGFSHFVVFYFLPPTTAKSVKFFIDVAGDYNIIAAPISLADFNGRSLTPFSLPFLKTTRAKGNIRDNSNRQTVEVSVNKLTGQSVFGIDLHGLVPWVNVAFNAEIARSFRYGKYPVQKGIQTSEHADALYLELSRDFGKVLMVTKAWDFDLDYDASFAVEDNDDRDDQPDVVDYYTSNLPGIDRNNESGPDYEEDWLLFTVDPPVFLEGVDYNNNDVLDNLENDAKPDYPNGWIVGTRGFHSTLAWKPVAGLRLTGGYRDEKRAVDETSNRLHHARARYSFGLPGGDAVLRYDFKRAKDTINNDLVTIPYDYAQRTENQTDTLVFRDAIRQQADVTLNFRPVEKLPITARYAHVFQRRKYNTSIVNQGIAILRGQYENWHPFRSVGFLADWQILPLFKFQREFSFSEAAQKRTHLSDFFTQSFGIEAIRKLSDKTKFFMGHQIQSQSNFLSQTDYDRGVTAFQLVHKNRFRDKEVVITTGVNIISKRSENAADNLETIFSYFRSYFQW